MNTEEKTMIIELSDRIGSTSVSNKDPEAEKLIQERIASHKDATYVMTQALLVQQHALTNLQNKVQKLEQQLALQAQSSNRKKGFFGGLFGGGQSNYAEQQRRQQTGNPNYAGNVAPGPGGHQGGVGQPGYNAGFGQPMYGGQRRESSFLGSAMSTAVGVAGGMALFSGIESLMGSRHESSASGTDSFLGGGDGFQGQDGLLDQGFGPSGDMNDLASGFGPSDDVNDLSSGFGSSDDMGDFSSGFDGSDAGGFDSDFGDW